MKKTSVTIPMESLEKVKMAMFNAGGGKYESYDHQCWQTLGQAEFRPLKGSKPHTGELGKLEIVKEYKVEMFCRDDLALKVIEAMLNSHL